MSTAATDTSSGSPPILDEHGRLSSASAATALKYAKPQDLPSFPSKGGVQLSSAGAAASLASSNQKAFEHWKPDSIPAANKAAMLAKDAKVDAIWTPEASAAGSKAAMLAHANPTQVEAMQPRKVATTQPSAAYDTSADTHKKAMMAATAASHSRRKSDAQPTQAGAQSSTGAAWAMQAATKSHRDAPVSSTGTGAFASGDPGFEAARIQNIAKNNVDRKLYTANPPVSIEVEEKNRQDTLRASAVAMAQKMYAIQQKHIDEAAGKNDGQALAASRARGLSTTGSDTSRHDVSTASGGYENLEEAARRLAQERLAKIHDEHAEYRNYYGQTSPQQNKNRLSMRLRRGDVNTAVDDDSDEEQSRKIRSQMSIFQSKLAEVDSKKRQKDRDNLLEIAHRNVDAQISKMDTKVFEETGKASPAQMEKWQKAAREKAQRDSDERMQHTGKVHIGGGKYLDQSELDAIAKARLQPTLDDISEKAEKQRAKDEQERLEREQKQQREQREKAEAAQAAAEAKTVAEQRKQEAKAAREEQKQEARVAKEEQRKVEAEEKARRRDDAQAEKERLRQEKEEKRKSKDNKPGRMAALFGRGQTKDQNDVVAPRVDNTEVATAVAVPSTEPTRTSSAEVDDAPVGVVATGQGENEPAATEPLTYHDRVTSPTEASGTPVVTKVEGEAQPTPIEASSAQPRQSSSLEQSVPSKLSKDPKRQETESGPPKSKVKSWMKHLRGKSDTPKEQSALKDQPARQGTSSEVPTSMSTVPRNDSARDVALAGRAEESDDLYGSGNKSVSGADAGKEHARSRSPSISSLSSAEDTGYRPPTNFTLGTTQPAAEEESNRTGLTARVLQKIKPGKGDSVAENEMPVSPTSPGQVTDEDFEEARDHFEEKAATSLTSPAPKHEAGDTGHSVTPKGSREGSRFTEQL